MLGRYLLYAAGFVVLTICSFSCEVITGPKFPDTPKISFRDIRKFRIKDELGNTNDSISIALKFQDGDGDMGIDSDEIGQPPFQDFRYYNYYVEGFQKVNGEWVPKEFTPTLNGQFPLLNTGKKGPIEGTLYYGIRFQILGVPQNTIYRFNVYILDRAGNISNTIETGEVTINEK